jgi:hypothetical protein
MQCACATVPSLVCLDIAYFFALSHKIHFSKKKIIEHKICVGFSTNSFEIFLILRRTERDMIINVNCSSCIVHVILVGFNET